MDPIKSKADKEQVMMQYLGAGLLFACIASAWGGPYEDCILQNMKGIQDRLAAAEIRRACEAKTTPLRCRKPSEAAQYQRFAERVREKTLNIPDNEIDTIWLAGKSTFWDKFERAKCVEECANASWWSRTFGECKTD